jgi:hypothetical protein
MIENKNSKRGIAQKNEKNTGKREKIVTKRDAAASDGVTPNSNFLFYGSIHPRLADESCERRKKRKH